MRTRLFLGSLPVLLALSGHTAHALPGTHAPAISTFDTRASSVVLAYRHGSSSGGPINAFSYNANFTNTTGKLSAQFGLHYVNFAPKINNETAHGVGASGVALFVFPVAGRWEDGVPKAALSFYVGSVPTIYISGERNYLTVPLTLGLGVPLSPHRVITFTPWFEMAPSANLDTIFKPANITANCTASSPQACGVKQNPDGSFSLDQSAIEDAVKKGVTIDTSFSVPMRAGLDSSLHLGQGADLNLYASLGSLGGGFGGATMGFLGGGFTFRWDDIVPAVLPVERRLEHEDCDAIEGRFRSCPNSRGWRSPEQRAREAQAAPAPATATQPAAIPPAPKPASPATTPSLTPAPTPVPSTTPSPNPETASPPGAPPSADFPTAD